MYLLFCSFQAFNQERRTVTLNEARRALTFESKFERSLLVNGTVHEKKGSERVSKSKPDASNNEAKDLPCLITSQKPVIIVHRATLDEKQEIGSQMANIPKDNDLILEEAVDSSLECKEDCNKENINSCGNINEQTNKRNDKLVKEGEIKSEKLKEGNEIVNNEISSIIKHEFPRNCAVNISSANDNVLCNQCETDTKKTTDLTDSCVEMSILSEKNMDTPKLKEPVAVKNPAINLTAKARDSSHSKTKDCGGKVQKKEAESRTHEHGDLQPSTDNTQGKITSQKPGPTVYMNKVSRSFFVWSDK